MIEKSARRRDASPRPSGSKVYSTKL